MGSRQPTSHDFLISRDNDDDHYGVWRFDPEAAELLTPLPLSPDAHLDRSHRLAAVGDYLLEWWPQDLAGDAPCYPFRLLSFDPGSADPLAATPLQQGQWAKGKYFGYRAHYSRDPNEGELLELIPLTSFVLSFIPAAGRGTFELWNFDPRPTQPGDADPLPGPYQAQEAFPLIQSGHELLPMGNYVLDRLPDKRGYRVWSFDPQSRVPLAQPVVTEGEFASIDVRHRLMPIGDRILDWIPEEGSYRLWSFDPKRADPLCGPLREGQLPAALGPRVTLLGVQPRIPVGKDKYTPGTIDFMRERIAHVVYYMLESRSFDNACGWLYEKGAEGVHFVGADGPYQGASTDYCNRDGDRRVNVSKFKGGALSEDWVLSSPAQDPFHGNPDTLVQMFGADSPGYPARARPDMSGFVLSSAADDVMESFTPEQLPILNGLARSFASSDAWFSSIPGGTDINRAYSVTGSAFAELSTWEGGNAYEYWPKTARRQSIWKVLWSNGVTDWKIYNAIEWMNQVFTYHLYLEGQVPTVDANRADYVASFDQFLQDALAGELPAFSFLEPVWIAPTGTTSYHPGASLVPGEVMLNEIYAALRGGPAWDRTTLVVTFDKAGGIYDHVAPPYAEKAWPNDSSDGFHFDLMGPRVPAIVASPWTKPQTVFRSGGPVPFDSTSFAATLLAWFGIPKARWGLGDRVHHAPTFEGVLLEEAPRKDAPVLTPPYDKDHPRRR